MLLAQKKFAQTFGLGSLPQGSSRPYELLIFVKQILNQQVEHHLRPGKKKNE